MEASGAATGRGTRPQCEVTRQRARYQKRCERNRSVRMLKAMAMRNSRKPQFTVMAPRSLKYEFTMRGLGICMTGAVLLRKMTPRGGPGTAHQVNAGWGETAGRVARLKERTSGFRAKRRRKLMKKWDVVGSVVLGAGLAVLPAVAQDAAKKQEVPKAAASPTQAVLAQWNDIGRKLIAMAEDFPEDKYEFKPNPEQRSFREGLLHVADVNYFFTNPVKGEKPPAQEDFSKDKLKTKAELAAYVKKSFT